MKTGPSDQPGSGVKALSNSRDSSIARAERQNLRQADSQTDPALVQQSLHLMRAAIRTTKKILPDADPELIGGFFADLFDLWETGQKLDKELRNLAGLRFPRDRERFRDILCWISAIQIDMASYWIGEINRDLPKLRQALYRLDGKSSRDKQKRMPAKKQSSSKQGVSKHEGKLRKKVDQGVISHKSATEQHLR